MRDDILLASDGDIKITKTGDIVLTESIRQAVIIRLRWFFAEWRFNPQAGFPYFEEVFIKTPNIPKIKGLLRAEVMSVEGVIDVKDIEIQQDNQKRSCDVSFFIQTAEEIIEKLEISLGEEVRNLCP